MRRVIGTALAAAACLCGSASGEDDAKVLLEEIRKAYVKAPAMIDAMKMEVAIPAMDDGYDYPSTIRFDKTSAEAADFLQMVDLRLIDGTLYMEYLEADKLAVKTEVGENGSLADAVGPMLAPHMPLQLIFRYESLDRIESLLGFGLVMNPKLAGVEKMTTDHGPMQALLLKGDGDGTVRLHVHPESRLIMKAVAKGIPEGFPGDEPITITTTCKPRVVDSLEKAIAFDDSGFELFDSLDEMMQAAMASSGDFEEYMPSIEVGSQAPAFTLVDQNGKEHSLAGYQGKVVLLDWWGVW